MFLGAGNFFFLIGDSARLLDFGIWWNALFFFQMLVLMGSKRLFSANLSRLKTWYRRENLLNLSCRLQVKSWRTGPSCFPGGKVFTWGFCWCGRETPKPQHWEKFAGRCLCRRCLGVHQNEGIYTRYTHILFWICTCIIQVHIYIYIFIFIHTDDPVSRGPSPPKGMVLAETCGCVVVWWCRGGG